LDDLPYEPQEHFTWKDTFANAKTDYTSKSWNINFTAVKDVTSIPPKIIARQLALINSETFKGVDRASLESLSWTGQEKWKKAPGVAHMIQQFNQVISYFC
jgi:hypothetical protein